MDDDLETGFYIAAGTAAAAGGGAIAIAGAGATGVGAVAVTVSTELADTAVEAAASAAIGAPVIIPVSPIDLVQDVGKLGVKQAAKKAVLGSANCFVTGTFVEMDQPVEETRDTTASDIVIATLCVPVALAGYSISRRRRQRHVDFDADSFFENYEGDLRNDRI